MALPTSGILTLAQIQTEFGGANPSGINEYYRGGAYVTTNNTGVPTNGAISVKNFYGAVKQFAFTNTTQYSTPQDLRTLALAAGWNGTDNVLFTNNSNITSNTTSSPALSIAGSFPNGVLFVNNGYLVGMGGAGGVYNQNGYDAGPAATVSTAVTITNNGTFAGGGGGGAAGVAFGYCGTDLTGTGGGGASGYTASAGGGCRYNACATGSQYDSATGFYDIPGTLGIPYNCGVVGSYGGDGGAWGNPGNNGSYRGPIWYGGAAGNSLSGNSYVTWLAFGTRTGPVV
jgi:hypothetical protein